jgi:hypothetical protein
MNENRNKKIAVAVSFGWDLGARSVAPRHLIFSM